jgi:hypothetical protein
MYIYMYIYIYDVYIIYEVYVRYYFISSDDDHNDRYKYHHRIFVVETSARGDVCACMCDDDGRRAAALYRNELGPRNFTVCPKKRTQSRRKPDHTVRSSSGDVRYTSTWRGHRGLRAYRAGERCTRTKAMTFCGCMYENSARNVNADRK